ncbi:MAG: TRAP transporter small permease subunit [Bacillota bacterium]|uniref:TRAP-type C4-dicarboxylate transport system, small permease component n=1 Tax=[Clostridium] aminophilum TaxID=1526 RepID=A0A1I6K2Q9_9FIRM|nr:TRAP transporter small permease subunit [[Clostridium] aminophilum]MDT3843726.1 TRAP transporter small permease subunit [Bacillota bacterium]SFR85466.1 TRAP-type C4-dicarboxylate transport system, small permease component [[Clostridium] aminophilum]
MKKILIKTGDILEKFNHGLELLTGFLLFAFMTLLCFQVMMRYVFSNPIYGIDELVVALMIWSCCLSWATVYWQNGHAILEFIVKNLPQSVRTVIFNGINVIVMILHITFIPGSMKLFELQKKQAPVGGLFFSKAYYYALPVLVMAVILSVYTAYKLIAYPVIKSDLIVAPLPSEEGNAID